MGSSEVRKMVRVSCEGRMKPRMPEVSRRPKKIGDEVRSGGRDVMADTAACGIGKEVP